MRTVPHRAHFGILIAGVIYVTPQPPPDIVRKHLEEILSSKTLQNSDLPKRLLRYVVNEGLEGRQPTETEIALNAFDKRSDRYDSRIDGSVRTAAKNLRVKLLEYYASEGLSASVRIKIPKGGYGPVFLWASRHDVLQSADYDLPVPGLVSELDPEIRRFFNDKRISVAGIDQFIELGHSPDWLGWSRGEIELKIVGDYELPQELERIVEEFPLRKGSQENLYYSLWDYSPIVADKGESLVIEVKTAGYRLANAYSRGAGHIGERRGPYRSQCEHLFQLRRSPLCHTISCHIAVLTEEKDGSEKLLLCRRSPDVDYFPEHWSASLEEHMMFKHYNPAVQISDAHPFDAVHRALESELNVPVDDADIVMLAFGIEWYVWYAAPCFVVNVHRPYDQIASLWASADDRNESSILDCIPANEDNLRPLFKSNAWQPSRDAWYGNEHIRDREERKRQVGGDHYTSLHPTSRVRIHALIRYLEARKLFT